MAQPEDHEMNLEDEYDEEADSDFDTNASAAENLSSESDDEENPVDRAPERPLKRRKIQKEQAPLITELDSGDEATIQEQKKVRRKGKDKAHEATEEDGHESEGWRARTRTMRAKEKDEQKKSKLASSKGSTLDVDRIWEEMNRPAPLPAPRIESEPSDQLSLSRNDDSTKVLEIHDKDSEKENIPVADTDETITIKRTYKFAGEVHVQEKVVLKSSAEAQLWLTQQQSSHHVSPTADGKVVYRPLRKVSRFDPNVSNIDAFRSSWAAANAQEATFKGPKLNVVEKSKMDWAEHVDSEGLKEELDTHAKAKDGYLTRMDFLRDVEDRKEAEAKAARLKGR